MAVDLSQTIRASFFLAWITVDKMRTILKGLKPDVRLYPNRVGNLTLWHKDECLGYIDFVEEEYYPINKGDQHGKEST